MKGLKIGSIHPGANVMQYLKNQVVHKPKILTKNHIRKMRKKRITAYLMRAAVVVLALAVFSQLLAETITIEVRFYAALVIAAFALARK